MDSSRDDFSIEGEENGVPRGKRFLRPELGEGETFLKAAQLEASYSWGGLQIGNFLPRGGSHGGPTRRRRERLAT